MRMPSLPLTLAVIALVWCVAGVMLHGWMKLLYPAAWLSILAFFLVLNKIYDAMHPSKPDTSGSQKKQAA